jgi:hypothetical protein
VRAPYPPFRKNLKFKKKCQLFGIVVIFYVIVVKYVNQIIIMSWHKKEEIESKEQLLEEIKIVMECLNGIPSMSDKLPNYIYNRIGSIIEFTRKNGWPNEEESN